MRIIGADRTNLRVKDLDAPLGFYRDVLGLELFGLKSTVVVGAVGLVACSCNRDESHG